MSFKTLSAIIRGKFLIDPGYAMDHVPFVQSILMGTRTFTPDDKRADVTINPADIDPDDDDDEDFASLDDDQEAVGNVGILEITGPIMHYGGMCSYGSDDYARDIQEMDENEDIAAIVLKIDSPGGQVDGTQTLANAIKACKKPILGFVNDGMACSAAYWIGCATDELYCSLPTDVVGSIGVMCSIMDYSKFLAKNGIKQIVVYAPQSTDKNKDYKEAVAGNTDLLQADLKFICDAFIQGVKDNRGNKLTSEDWSTGATFFAEQAQEIGLIDGIKSFNQVILRAAKLSAQPKSGAQAPNLQRSGNEQANPKNQNMSLFGTKFKKLNALTGKKAADISDEEIEAVNEELKAEGVENVVVITSTHLAEADANADAVSIALTAINKTLGAGNEKTTLGEAVSALNASHKAAAKDRDDWKKKAEEYGDQPGEIPSAAVAQIDDEGKTPAAGDKPSWEKKMDKKVSQTHTES